MTTFLCLVLVYISSVVYCTVVYLLRGPSTQNRQDSKIDHLLKDIISYRKGAISHRGGIPENTVTAFNRSKLGGAKAVEVDLQFTKDGHPVLFHDWTVDRVSDGSGHLHDMTLKEIQSLHINIADRPTMVHPITIHEGATVPTLYEAVEALKELDMYMFLELKDPRKKTISTILHLFEDDSTLYNRIIIISFFPHIIYKINQVDPNINIGLVLKKAFLTKDTLITDGPTASCCPLFKYLLQSTVERIVWRLLTCYVWRSIGVNLLLPHKEDVLTNRFDVDYFQKEHCMQIVTWTVNSSEEKEYFESVLRIPYMTDSLI